MTDEEAYRRVENFIDEYETEIGHGELYIALSMASHALGHQIAEENKRIPKEPLRLKDCHFRCPSCGHNLSNCMLFCDFCGQALDWRDD